MFFKIVYIINHEDDVIAYPVVTFSFFQHHGTGRYLSLLHPAMFAGHQEGGQPRGAVDQQELSWRRPSSSTPRISPAPEFSRPSLYESLGPATKTQNVTHRSCQGHLKIFPRHSRVGFVCRLVLKKSPPHDTGETEQMRLVGSPNFRQDTTAPSRGCGFGEKM